MKILLKDATEVDAVIWKINKKYWVSDEFIGYCLPHIRKKLQEGEHVILDIDYGYDPQSQQMEVALTYDIFSEIPTDEEFINDKEW